MPKRIDIKKLKLASFILGSMLISSIAILLAMNFQGLCTSSQKHLAEDEKIRLAIEDVLDRYPPPIVFGKNRSNPKLEGYDVPRHPIYYSSVDEFFILNKDCCSFTKEVSSEQRSIPIFERLTGSISGIVLIKYQVRFFDEAGVEKMLSTMDRLPVSNCGKPQRWWDSIETSWIYVLYRFIKWEIK